MGSGVCLLAVPFPVQDRSLGDLAASPLMLGACCCHASLQPAQGCPLTIPEPAMSLMF